MKGIKVLLLTSLILLLFAVPLLGACTQEVVKTVPVEKTVVQTQTVAVEKTTVVEKTVKVLPSIIGFASRGTTGTGATALALVDALSKQLGIKVVYEDYGTFPEMFLAVKSGRSLLLAGSTNTVRDALLGNGDYSQPEWGPQPLRTLVVGRPRFWGFYTSKKTGITTFADVKGKRVPYFPGSSTRNDTMEGVFKAHGFTWDDVKKVSFDDTGAAQQALIDGLVDVAFTGFPAPKMVELEATQGCVVIGFDQTPEMEKRFHELLPHDLVIAAKGEFVGVLDNILLPASVDYTMAYDFLDEDYAYTLTKAVYESIPDIAKTTAGEGLTQKGTTNVPAQAPFHPGAIKFFKEVGLWGAAQEAWQQKALQEEQARMAAWKAK